MKTSNKQKKSPAITSHNPNAGITDLNLLTDPKEILRLQCEERAKEDSEKISIRVNSKTIILVKKDASAEHINRVISMLENN